MSGSDKDDDIDDDDVEDYGWKLLHGDVFRFPPYRSLFCAILGEVHCNRSRDTLWNVVALPNVPHANIHVLSFSLSSPHVVQLL